jgi:hypothetical protein
LQRRLHVFIERPSALFKPTHQTLSYIGVSALALIRRVAISWREKPLDVIVQFLLILIAGMMLMLLILLMLLLLLSLYFVLMISLNHLFDPFSLLFLQKIGLLHLKPSNLLTMRPKNNAQLNNSEVTYFLITVFVLA